MNEKHEKLKKIFSQSLIIFFGLALSILFFFLLFQAGKISSVFGAITAILRPFILGGIFAYIMKSTCNLLEKSIAKLLRKCKMEKEKLIANISSISSLVLTYIIWISAIAILLRIVVPQFIDSIMDLIVQVPQYLDDLKIWITGLLADSSVFEETAEFIVDGAYDQIYKWVEGLISSLQNMEGDLVTKILSSVSGVFSIVFDTVIGLVVSFFILKGRRTLAAKSSMILHSIFKEKTAAAIIDEFKFADRMFSGFLEGKVIDSTLIGVLYYIALMIMDIPYAPLIAVLCGVTNIIPIFGPFIGAIPSGFIILAGGEPIKVLYFVIFVCIMQFLDGYIIDPLIVGDHVNVSSLAVIFAVTFFGGIWGFFGLLIGVPTYAVIYDMVKKMVIHGLKKRGKYDLVEKYQEQNKKKKDETERKHAKKIPFRHSDNDSNTNDNNASDKENEEVGSESAEDTPQ